MADGVWRTIKGRHVFIRKGENLKDAINKRKEEIQTYRNEAKKQISDVREGKEELNRIRTDANNWDYVTDEKGNVKKNTDGSLKIKYGPRSKQYHDTKEKIWYTWAGPETNEKYREDATNALKMQDAYVYDRGHNTISANEFKDRLKKGQIKENKINELKYYADAAVGGNRKSEDERINKLKALETQMDAVYSKSPINVSESDFKRFNKPMMQDALNDLYLTQVQSKDANEELTRWKALSNSKNAYSKSYKDMVNKLNSLPAKEQIKYLNNTKIFTQDGYMLRNYYYPESEYMISDVHNFNKRDDMSYPDVYQTTNNNKKVYGVNWSAMGTMAPEYANEYANRIKNASDFAKAATLAEEMNKSYFTAMNKSQVIRMFMEQGYSSETARKMAQEYLKNRKRK